MHRNFFKCLILLHSGSCNASRFHHHTRLVLMTSVSHWHCTWDEKSSSLYLYSETVSNKIPRNECVIVFFNTIVQLNSVFCLNNNNENEQFSLPFYHLHQVCDQNNQMIHTLTAPARGNIVCDSKCTHSNNLVFYDNLYSLEW